MKSKILACTVVMMAMAAAAASRADAAPIAIGAFVGNDVYDWTDLPLTPAAIASGTTVTSEHGRTATITGATAFVTCTEGGYGTTGGCLGNFTPGDRLLANMGSWLAIDFASPVSAVGAQVQNNYRGAYTVQMFLFDASHVQIGGPFVAQGTTTFLADDTSPFLGAMDGSMSISRVLFTVTSWDIAPGMIINDVQVMVPNPEPATLLLLGTGLGLVAYRRLRSRRS